jgi:S-methylmethionine-dependent homocysteine/selenocysteine methylase
MIPMPGEKTGAFRPPAVRVLDGAMGTELRRRGADTALPLWSARALIDDPEIVRQIHRDYIAAGADIITANTFRTTRRTFLKAGLADRSEELTRLAVRLAHLAREEFPERRVLIAGSIAPLEDCYAPGLVPPEPELGEEHAAHARRLAEAGAEVLLCETMGTIREAAAACRAAVGTGRETVVSFLCAPDGNLYSGEPLSGAVSAIEPLGPSAFSINCVSPRFMEKAIATLKTTTRLPFGVYGNAGIPGGEASGRPGAMECDVDPAEYAGFARRWIGLGASFMGGCCGTTPEYIRQLAKLLGR